MDNNFANDYFANHLDNNYWNSLTEQQGALLAMANDDILNLVGQTKYLTHTFVQKAICEQAIFLARNHDNTKDGTITTSESFDGMSENREAINKNNLLIAPRAQNFINSFKKLQRKSSVKITR
ncbi:hypothetical protein AAEX28_04145 [Lentisphaerota bacterium WC36G]|nr:hypothetical protein LJT99_07015 [Lentisphaerae bacterium WC36]